MGRSSSRRYSWADVPDPGNMADFDLDVEDESPGVFSWADDSDYWELDDWGDD